VSFLDFSVVDIRTRILQRPMDATTNINLQLAAGHCQPHQSRGITQNKFREIDTMRVVYKILYVSGGAAVRERYIVSNGSTMIKNVTIAR